jgi:methionyl-tRNA formyltransferase
MIPSKVINAFPSGMLVMHPSLLPLYRGACPIQHALLNRDTESGVSIIEISPKKFDAGAIISQKSLPIASTTTFAELSVDLAKLGG